MKRIFVVLLAALPILAQVRGAGGGGARGGGAGPHPGSGFGGSSRGSGFVGGAPAATFPTPASAGNSFGFGSVVFPGGSPGAFGTVVSPVYANNQSFAGRLGTVVSGTPPLIVAPGQRGNNLNGRSRSGGIYPVFIGGGYGYGYGTGYYNGYDNGYYQDPQLINQQPPVIINQNFVPDPPARPSMQVYGDGADPSVNTIQVASPSYPEGRPIRLAGGVDTTNPTDEPTIYLIALKDGTIYASYAFWAERDTLHYITPGHAQNQVSLDRVDVALSRRLNRERNLDFNLK